ncbi:MAG TPA: hypothetical protein PL004_12815, partial [Bacillota bacterium]|nr:hypothetical protein [Bacillota bacterium]
FFRNDKKAKEFREWLESVGGSSEKLPEGSFKSSERPTGVATRLVVIEKAGESTVKTTPDFSKLEAAAKEAGFKDLDEAVLAFQAKKNGIEWFKAQENTKSGKQYAELMSKIYKMDPEKRKLFEFDLQRFAAKENKMSIEERTFEMVSKRSVRAYQQLHPELADFIQAEAIRLISDLAETIKGERFVTEYEGETIVTHTTKMTSEAIQRIQDATGATYAEIGEALEAIAKGTEKINTALAKKIELIIDDNLTHGTVDIYGEQIPPDQQYILAKKNVKPVTDLELYDSKQIEKLKAKYEARIQKMKQKDREKLEWQIYQVKSKAAEKLASVKKSAAEKVAKIKEKAKKQVNRVKYQEMWRRLLEKQESKEAKAEAIKKLREFYKKREEHMKEVQREKELEKRQMAAEKKIRNKLIDNIKKISSKIKYLRPEFQRPVKALLDEINLTKPTRKTLNRLIRIAQYLEANPDNRLPKEVIARLKVLNRKNVRDMNIEELKVLHDAVVHYVHLNMLKNKLIMKQKYVEFNDVKSKLIEAVMTFKAKKRIPAADDTTSRPGLERVGVNKFFRKQLNIENIAQELDGKKGGEFYKIFYEGADEARDMELSVHYSLHDFIQNEMEQQGIKHDNIMGFSELFNTRKENVERIKVKLENGKTIEITKADRIALYLHSLNDNNRASVLKGGVIPDRNRTVKWNLTEKDLNTIIDGMTDTEKKIANIFYRVYNELSKEYLNERSLELDGFERAIVENYYPKSTPEIERRIDTMKMRDNPFGRFTIEGMGFLHERTGSKKAIILEDAFKTMFKHIEGLAAYYGRARFLRNAKMVLYDKDLRKQLESIDNGFTWKQLESYIQDQETFGYAPDDIDRVVGRWLNNTATAILGANAKVVIKQFLSYPLMFNHIDAKYLLSTMDNKAGTTLEDIAKESVQLRQRIEGAVTVETGEMGRVGPVRKFFTGKEYWGTKLTRGIEWADSTQLLNCWNAVVAETKDKYPDLDPNSKEFKQIVAKRVEEIFRHVQSVFDVKDRSELARSKNLLFRVMTMFTSQRNVIYNEIYRVWLDWDQSQKTVKDHTQTIGKLANILIVGATLEYFIEFLWRALTGKKKDREKEKFNPLEFASSMVENWLSYIYSAGEAYKVVELIVKKGSDYGVYFRAPLFDAAMEPLKAIGAAATAVQDILSQERFKSGPNRGKLKWERSIWQAVKSAITFAGQIKGIPVGPIIRQIKPIYERLKGD